jgi:hypothetical protein
MVLVGILGAAIEIGVLLPGLIDESLLLDQSADLAIGKEGLEVRVFQGVVVGQRHLVDVVRVDELLLGLVQGSVVSAHA